MHRQYYHLSRLHSAVATSDGDKLESMKKKEKLLLRSSAQLVGLFDMLHGYISHKLASLGFIYEPMILPAICLNGNVTTLAQALALSLSLLPKWKHVTRCQLVSKSSNKSFGFSFELWQTQASFPLLLTPPLPPPASHIASNHSCHLFPSVRGATFAFQFGFSTLLCAFDFFFSLPVIKS